MSGERKCESCGDYPFWNCTWPCEKYIAVRTGELKPGDKICRFHETAPKRGSYAIVGSATRSSIASIAITITIFRANRPGKTLTFNTKIYSQFRRLGIAACGALACENCAQNPADGARYCPDHWTIRTLGRSEVE